MKLHLVRAFFCVLICVSVSACSWLDERRKVDYGSATTLPPLDVPPDLTSVPEKNLPPSTEPSTTTYSAYVGDKKAEAANAPAATVNTPRATVLPEASGVRMQRDGQKRWLVVNAAPETIWPYLRAFIQDNGLKVNFENSTTGVIESDWLEDRAKTVDGKYTEFAKLLSPPATSGRRDKFRFVLERGEQTGTTLVRLTNIGTVKAGTAKAPQWQVGTADHELEAEVLQLLTARIATVAAPLVSVAPVVSTDATDQPVAPVVSAKLIALDAPIHMDGYEILLDIKDPINVAWGKVGVALNRAGIMVESKKPEKNVYYIIYTDRAIDELSRSTLNDFFGMKTKPTPPIRYEIRLRPEASGSAAFIRTEAGATMANVDIGKYILALIHRQL